MFCSLKLWCLSPSAVISNNMLLQKERSISRGGMEKVRILVSDRVVLNSIFPFNRLI